MKTEGNIRYNIFTHSGLVIRNIDKPIDPHLICIEDIAHGLANLCRFSGQSTFYTVAAHSVLVSNWIEARGGTPLECLWGLLHDASEAYITDLPLPVKVFCPQYYVIESAFMKAVCQRFDLPVTQPEIVYTADKAVLEIEKRNLFDDANHFPFSRMHPVKEFIRRFEELGGKRRKARLLEFDCANIPKEVKGASKQTKRHTKRRRKVRRRKVASRTHSQTRVTRGSRGA